MDLAKLDTVTKSEEGKWFPILREGAPTGIEIKLMGVDSKAFKSQAAAIRKYTQKQRESGAMPNDAEMDDKSFNMLAAVTVGWREVDDDGKEVKKTLTMNGDDIKFSVENAKYIYATYPLIANQVTQKVMDRSLFLAD